MPETTPRGLTGLAFGGDYNPEQWPESVWDEDVRLMREAGVTMVSAGIFSWALLQPAPGVYDFGWLDRNLDLLHDAGIRVDLGTPTVVPPAWFYRAHPDALPVTEDGVRLEFGSRGAICHSSADYRAAAANITTKLAERYGDHPALAMWHVHNEYGVPVSACYCESCAAHFRRWLEREYGTVDGVNEAWGTAFWGQHYAAFDEINPPRRTPTVGNPAQALDYRRFADATMRENFTAERDILHRLSPGVPVTTNFMTALSQCDSVDYWAWGREADLVTNDHYLITDGRRTHVNLAMAADLTRSVAGGAPWLLLEHSTSGVNWQPRNPAKAPGQMARNSLAHVARGSDGAMFFQWRQSRRGAEKFHSAMLPHGGTETRVFREVTELGAAIDSLAPVRGTRTEADAARAVGLALLVGAEPRLAPQRGPRRPRTRRRLLRGPLRPPPHRRLRPPRGRLVEVSPCRRTGPVPDDGGGREQPQGVRRERRDPRGVVLLRHRRRARRRARGPLPGRPARRPRPDRRGVLAPAPGRAGPAGRPRRRRTRRRRVDRVRGAARRRDRVDVRRRPHRRPSRRHPAPARRGHRLVRLHPAGRRGPRHPPRPRRRGRPDRPARRSAPRRRSGAPHGRVGHFPVRDQPHRHRCQGAAGDARHRTADR
ncbi:beta-galactosidase [Streptomyces griseoflavus Tu4000]|uniref:Beta-galactosidase n=1 Tax=Streptomyces griseoflavus Tu4000 TaxID=467200 RepID=D9XW77_9ACTN|nr:beta-galactosidase [Streptomyces griseoflavus Tu4000]